MSEEFDIFKNLEELRKTNVLDQLKSMELSKNEEFNGSQDLDDTIDFDLLLNNDVNVKKGSIKRQHKQESTTPKKKSKENANFRRSSRDGSISPIMPLLENLSKKLDEMPIGRRTRKSLGAHKSTPETIVEYVQPSTSKNSGSGKKSGRGRGRVRGRGRPGTSISNSLDSTPSLSSSNDVSENNEHADNATLTSSNLVGRGRGRGRGRPRTNISNNLGTTFSLSSSNDVSENNEHSDNATLVEHFLQQGCNWDSGSSGRRGSSGRSRVMRARRQYLSEVAARSTQIDTIDLVSSPMPRVEGFIDLDSDTEETTRSKKNLTNISQKDKTSATNVSLNISYDDDNPELNIKVNWKGKPEAFKMRKYQKFSIIFTQLAQRENISMDSIVFNLNDRIIMADDTPDSINYKIFHFIDGRVLTNHFNSTGSLAAAGKKRDANNITLKIQSDKWKKPMQMKLMKTDKFRILYIKCAEELNVGLDQLKLSFDGEFLEPNDTPGDLDFEGGEAIDLHIK